MTQETQFTIGSVVWTVLIAAGMIMVDAPKDSVGAIIIASTSILAGFSFYFTMRWRSG